VASYAQSQTPETLLDSFPIPSFPSYETNKTKKKNKTKKTTNMHLRLIPESALEPQNRADQPVKTQLLVANSLTQ
jgi:hypothetical protein